MGRGSVLLIGILFALGELHCYIEIANATPRPLIENEMPHVLALYSEVAFSLVILEAT